LPLARGQVNARPNSWLAHLREKEINWLKMTNSTHEIAKKKKILKILKKKTQALSLDIRNIVENDRPRTMRWGFDQVEHASARRARCPADN
jgi:hypothetical protein